MIKFKSLFIVLFLVCFTYSCNEIKEKDLQNLEGYWEIKKVAKENGKEKIYKFNETVDFIEFNDQKGVRTKVKPTLDGEFFATNDAEAFSISKENNQWIFHYHTEMDDWDETLLKLDKDELKVKNKQDIIYTYQRFNGYLDGKK
ncbi:lipocalin family protein [Mesonia aestuariivivens]|uniref:Lipocalin-like domain-containing protein n=1 Tax=Mesonia aestuariivivens TaxID=2796128 RepID=A0ABS6W0T6_9FLAO|nr:lipocalin family protein [Mesonia aestuariivivens]MBW2961157.1 hypothetical protein [Mesonia aestuariivivens]